MDITTSFAERKGETGNKFYFKLAQPGEFRANFREVLSGYVRWQRKFPRTTRNGGGFIAMLVNQRVVGAISFSAIETIF